MKKSNKKSNNMIDNMYRYLEKFIGTYRVMAEYDLQTNDFPRDEEGNIDFSECGLKKAVEENVRLPNTKGWDLDNFEVLLN